MGEHAKLSPSSAKRWLVCTASAEAASRSVTPDTEHSLNGTAGHWVRSEWMLNGDHPPVGVKAPNGVVVTQEMVDLVRPGIEWTRQYVKDAGGACAVFVEERTVIAPFFGLPPEVCFGTADQVILAPRVLQIYDLKLGYVDVAVDGNEQLSLYALGMLMATGWMHDEVEFVIDQPRQGGMKVWRTTAAALRAWAEGQRANVVEAAGPNGRYVPSDDGCRYCPVAGVCAELQQHALALAKQEFADDPLEVVKNITIEELATILTKADMVEVAIKAAREHARKLIQTGVEVPGWKVVESRKNRVWVPGAGPDVVMILGDEKAYDRKLISPAQAEKLAGEKVKHLIVKPKGEPVLAPVSDKRPALAAHFDIIPDLENMLD